MSNEFTRYRKEIVRKEIMSDLFTNIVFDDEAKEISGQFKKKFEEIYFMMIDFHNQPELRKLAINRLKESSMWINEAIKIDMIHRKLKDD